MRRLLRSYPIFQVLRAPQNFKPSNRVITTGGVESLLGTLKLVFLRNKVFCGQCCGSGPILYPYSGASWIRIRIRTTHPDPHMQI